MKNKTRIAQRLALVPLGFAAAALTISAASAFTPQQQAASDKEATVARMLEIGQQVQELRASGAPRHQINRLMREYTRLSASMGGDDPAQLIGGGVPGNPAPEQPTGGIASAPPAPPGCTSSSMTFTNSTPVAIPDPPPAPATISSTIPISGAGPVIWDVNLTTFITHTDASDLDVTLMSPAGTIVTITTDNGGGNDDVYNGTLWDDDADPDGQVPYTSNDGLVTDSTYATGVVETPLVPEEALGAFIGENPNGTWTLTVVDDAVGDFGSLNSWSLDILTIAAAPTTTTTNLPNATAVAIPSPGPGVVSSTIVASGLDTVLTDVNLTTNITHTNNSDLDITIMSPAGTIVTLTTDNGGSNDNVYNGTLWDDDADPDGQVPYTSNDGLVTDSTYANNVVETPLVPEEAMAAFIGENPNGTWTLTISDDLASASTGSLNSWSLDLTTATAAPATTLASATNNTAITFGEPTVVMSSITVSGLDTYLWDVDLTTFITHTFPGDYDISLTSPAGTIVTISSGNGGGNDNVHNGTLFDDDADPDGQVPYTSNNGMVTDHLYANLTTATPLTPEEALGAFIGENPNGVWTLRVVDKFSVDTGSLNSWSLAIATLGSTPVNAAPVVASNATSGPINAANTTVTRTAVISGADAFACDVNLALDVSHAFSSDLDMTIMSPAGTIVTISTDNAGGNENVFAGTTFDDDADPNGQVPFITNPGSATDHPYVDLVVATPLTPEEPLAAFIGEDPNGTWTLTISDDFASLDDGAFNSFSVSVVTCECGADCPGDITGDGIVDVNDLLALIGAWNETGNVPEDITGDGVVDVNDLLALMTFWGDVCD